MDLLRYQITCYEGETSDIYLIRSESIQTMSPCIYLRQAFSDQHRNALASYSDEQNRKIQTTGPVVFLPKNHGEC